MMKKLAIYTCITGGYDPLIQPVDVVPWCDFICFVPEGEERKGSDGVWQLRSFSGFHGSPAAMSRYPKMHPTELLPEYEYSLWIDGNVGIASAGFYDVLAGLMDKGVLYAGIPHPGRDCAYEEAAACVRGGKSGLRPMLAAVGTLSAAGLPRHAGLWENNVILRRHSDSAVAALDRRWWELYLGCGRDQLVLPLCLREAGIIPVPLLPSGESARNSAFLSYRYHDRPEDGRFFHKKWRGLGRSLSNLVMSLRLRSVR